MNPSDVINAVLLIASVVKTVRMGMREIESSKITPRKRGNSAFNTIVETGKNGIATSMALTVVNAASSALTKTDKSGASVDSIVTLVRNSKNLKLSDTWFIARFLFNNSPAFRCVCLFFSLALGVSITSYSVYLILLEMEKQKSVNRKQAIKDAITASKLADNLKSSGNRRNSENFPYGSLTQEFIARDLEREKNRQLNRAIADYVDGDNPQSITDII